MHTSTYPYEAVVEGEADEPGQDARGGFGILHSLPYDLLRLGAILVGVIADLEVIRRWRWGIRRGSRKRIRPWALPAPTEVYRQEQGFAGNRTDQRRENDQNDKLGHMFRAAS
jgi:hypothetical protein